jgi:hypothetical protein
VDNSKQTDIIPFVSQLVAHEFLKAAPKTDLAMLRKVVSASTRVINLAR